MLDIDHLNRNPFDLRDAASGGSGIQTDKAFADAVGQAKVEDLPQGEVEKGQIVDALRERRTYGHPTQPLSEDALAHLRRSDPGVLPLGDTRSAQEIIEATPALAHLRQVHKDLLSLIIPGFETDPEAAYHAAAVITHIKNFDANGDPVKDRKMAESDMIYGFKSNESIHTHNNTEARRFEDFIRKGYSTLRGGEEIVPFMPFGETRTAEKIIADNPTLAGLNQDQHDKLDKIIPGYQRDARAAYHADRIIAHLHTYDGFGNPISDWSDEDKARRVEAFLDEGYDALGKGLDAHDSEASLQHRDEVRSRLTNDAKEAAANFDKDRYDTLVAAGADGEAAPYRDARDALGDAVRSGDFDEVERLLDTGKVDINAFDEKGRTVLFDLVDTPVNVFDRTGPSSMLKLLLSNGADATRRDQNGVSVMEALQDAAIIRSPYRIGDAVQTRAVALNNAANNLRAKLTAELGHVVLRGDAAWAVRLIKAGADISGLDAAGISHLSTAIAFGPPNLALEMLDALPTDQHRQRVLNMVEVDGNTPMHAAMLSKDPGIIQELMERGGRHDIRNNAGKALSDAADHLQKRVAPVLILGAGVAVYLGLKALFSKHEKLVSMSYHDTNPRLGTGPANTYVPAYMPDTTGGSAAEAFKERFGEIPNPNVRATRQDLQLAEDDILLMDIGGEGAFRSETRSNRGNVDAVNLNWRTSKWIPDSEELFVDHDGNVVQVNEGDISQIPNLIRVSNEWDPSLADPKTYKHPAIPMADGVVDAIMMESAPMYPEMQREIIRTLQPNTGFGFFELNARHRDKILTIANALNLAVVTIPSGYEGFMKFVLFPKSVPQASIVEWAEPRGNNIDGHTFYDFVRDMRKVA